ncbi:hypothetical protein THRCLA_00293, partial [Thraustotheca clavata]
GHDITSNQGFDVVLSEAISVEVQNQQDANDAHQALLQLLNTIPKVNASDFKEEALISQTHEFCIHLGTLNGERVVRKQLSVMAPEDAVVNRFKTSIAFIAKLAGGEGTIISLKGVADIESQRPIVFLEYMENGNLHDKLLSEIEWSKRLDIAIQVARGLAKIHELNLLHRDINSYHIVLDKNDVAKVTGMNHLRVESKGSMTMGVGCTRWAAPETMREGEFYSSKADIYSLGLVLIELYTQKKPYSHMVNSKGKLHGDSVLRDIIQDAKENDKVFQHEFYDDPELNKWYKELAWECVSFNPAKRPSALEVIRRLEQHLFKNEEFSEDKSNVGISCKMAATTLESPPPVPCRVHMILESIDGKSLRVIHGYGYKSAWAQLSVGGVSRKTNQPPNDGPDPLWKEDGYKFDNIDMIDMTLEINISYKTPNESEIGVCTIPIYKLYSDSIIKEDVYYSGTKKGSLKIMSKFSGDTKTHLEQHLSALLHSTQNGKQHPYCQLTLANHSTETRIDANNGCEPTWNENFEFSNVHLIDSTVEAEIRYDSIVQGRIGKCNIDMPLIVESSDDMQASTRWLPVYSHGEHHGYLVIKFQSLCQKINTGTCGKENNAFFSRTSLFKTRRRSFTTLVTFHKISS